MTDIKTKAKITCPECGHIEEVEMPTDYCQIVYECPHCLATIRPKKGFCCVFCSYADTLCPPKQIK
jgi:hypothetical protein